MHKDRTCSCRGERGERGKFDEKTREGCWRLSMAPKCNSTTGSQARYAELKRLSSASTRVELQMRRISSLIVWHRRETWYALTCIARARCAWPLRACEWSIGASGPKA